MTEADVAVDELAALLRDGDRILVATGAGEPATLVSHLLEAADVAGASLELVQVMTGSRGGILQGRSRGHRLRVPVPGHDRPVDPSEILPSSMLQLARGIDTQRLRIDGVLFAATATDDATLVPGLCVDLVPAAFRRARFRAAERNAALPHVWTDAAFGTVDCEVVVDSDVAPPPMDGGPVDDVARRIGDHVATLVDDGDVLELGIGRPLAGIADALCERAVSISVHTGLISDWTHTVVEGGVAERPAACADVPVVASVAMGSAGFYGWLGASSAVRLVESLHAHDPRHLIGGDRFVAVNAAARIDLSGQVGVPDAAADGRVVGGLLDFAVAGAYGGRSVVALPSVDSAGRSRIVPALSAVQLPGSLVTHVVTEHGVAELADRTWQERRRALIGVADPEYRQALQAAGR